MQEWRREKEKMQNWLNIYKSDLYWFWYCSKYLVMKNMNWNNKFEYLFFFFNFSKVGQPKKLQLSKKSVTRWSTWGTRRHGTLRRRLLRSCSETNRDQIGISIQKKKDDYDWTRLEKSRKSLECIKILRPIEATWKNVKYSKRKASNSS